MTVIESDGVETVPVEVDSLEVSSSILHDANSLLNPSAKIFAAQRYSVVVEANATVGNYCKCNTASFFSF